MSTPISATIVSTVRFPTPGIDNRRVAGSSKGAINSSAFASSSPIHLGEVIDVVQVHAQHQAVVIIEKTLERQP